MKYKFCRILAVMLAALILTGCMDPPPISQPNPYFAAGLNTAAQGDDEQEVLPQAPIRPSTPVAGGNLRIAMPMPATLNPLLNSDPHVDAVLRLVFEPLVIFDAEKRPVPNPAITQSVVFSPGGGTVAVTLLNDIFWEDGSPITAADIAFSIDVLRNSAPESAIYRENVANIASHTVLDSRTLQINLRNPMWAMKYMLNFPIIPADYYRPVSMTNLRAARNMHPLGNGPFRFLSYEAAGSLELIANENAPGGAPYIGRVTAMILREADGARYAFEQGLTDISADEMHLWGRYGATGKKRAAHVLTNEFDFMGFNFNNPLFAEYSMRAAVAHSFDLDAIIHRYYAASDAAIAPISPDSWLAVEDLRRHPFDIRLAAMYFRGLEEIPQITIIVNEANMAGVSAAGVLADGLRAAGAVVSLETLAFSSFASRINEGNFDIMVGGISAFPPTDFGFLHELLGYSSEDFDLALSMKRYAISESALQQAAAGFQHYIAENIPIIGIGFRRQALYTTGHVFGDIEISANDIFANVNDWFIYQP